MSEDDNGIDYVLIHPPFSESYSCSEHWHGQLPHPGDSLGTDCTVGKLVEEDGRLWVREYKDRGLENDDWYGYGVDVLAPCDCTVAEIRINPEENLPGKLGKPPSTSITFERPDGTLILLAHLKEIQVSKGDTVSAGDVVASVGNNGYSRQPHVHIGAWRDTEALQIRFDQKRMRSAEKATADRPDKASILNALGLDKFAQVALKDSDGEAISDAEFIDAMLAGQRFSIEKDSAKSRAVLSLTGLDSNGSHTEPDTIAIEPGAIFPTNPLDHVKTAHEQALLVNFFFAACAPCIQEVPALNAFQRAHPDIAVAAVTFDDNETAQEFSTSLGFEWPVVPDAADYIESVGVSVFPTLVLVASDGRLAGVKSGGTVTISGGAVQHFDIEDWVASLEER